MTTTMLRIVDEKPSGEAIKEMVIPFDKPTVTLKDIIASRVEIEVQKYNEKLDGFFNGLVCPTEAEETLNGFKMRKKNQKIDAERQVYVALEAFQGNGYFVFVDDLQVEDLNEEVQIAPETKVSFIKLTPLVGG